MIAELKNVVPELFDTGRTGVRLGVKTVDHPPRILMLYGSGHCCKVSDEAAFCLIQRPYISKTLLTRRISPRGSP